VKAILEDSSNIVNINPTLGSNFPTETIMKIVRIMHFCLQPNLVHQSTMSDVINEINGALQLEEGLKAEESAMKIEIPQYVSQSKTCASLETAWAIEILEPPESPGLHLEIPESPVLGRKFKWHKFQAGMLVDEGSSSRFDLVDINPKGERQQQPQTIFTQSHGSRLVFQIVLI
jgi:hypothetical protein